MTARPTANGQAGKPQAATRPRRVVAGTSRSWTGIFLAATIFPVFGLGLPVGGADAGEPAAGTAKQVDLGSGVTLEVVYVPPGKFTMGSTPEERLGDRDRRGRHSGHVA